MTNILNDEKTMATENYMALPDFQTLWDGKIKPWILQGKYVPTLEAAPTAQTTTYTKDGKTVGFEVGQFARVADASAEEGYVFYQLYDLATSGGVTTAKWKSVIPTSLPASDVYSWAKAASKPSYGYSEIGYTVNAVTSAGGTLSLDGTVPLHVVTLTGNVSALTLSANPPAGHSCHIIFTAAAEYTVAIAHDATNRVCPDGSDPGPLTIPANGYIEVDFLSAGGKVYVRGI